MRPPQGQPPNIRTYPDPAPHALKSLSNACVLKEHRRVGDLAVPSQPLTPGRYQALPARAALSQLCSVCLSPVAPWGNGVWKCGATELREDAEVLLEELELALLGYQRPYCDQPEEASHVCSSCAESSHRGPCRKGVGLSKWEGWGGVRSIIQSGSVGSEHRPIRAGGGRAPRLVA